MVLNLNFNIFYYKFKFIIKIKLLKLLNIIKSNKYKNTHTIYEESLQ